MNRLFSSSKPIIAAINGAAVGVGVAMTLAMDIRLASTRARFGFVYTQRGIAPEAFSSVLLPRVVGIGQSMKWMLTGDVFGSDEAVRGGLVSEVLEPEALLPRARELATSIAARAPLSIAVTRQLLWRQLDQGTVPDAHLLESRIIPFLAGTPDAAEGVRSFLEKRSPQFTGKVSTDFPGRYPWKEVN